MKRRWRLEGGGGGWILMRKIFVTAYEGVIAAVKDAVMKARL